MKFLSVDFGGTSIKWAVISDQYVMLKKSSMINDLKTAEDLLQCIIFLKNNCFYDIDGIGISIPGTVKSDDNEGIIYGGGAMPFMHGYALKKEVYSKTMLPCAVMNDGKCCALSEARIGALRDKKSGVVLALGTGVGGGIVIDHQIVEGSNGNAGEFSFMRIHMEQPYTMNNIIGYKCSWLELKRIILQAKHMEDDETVSGIQLFEWINHHDEASVQGLKEYADGVDQLILQLQMIFDPDAFVIAGGISAQDILIETLHEQMDIIMSQIPFNQIPHPVILKAANGNEANLYGAVSNLIDCMA